MNYWKESKSWELVRFVIVLVLVGGLALYIGYQSFLTVFTQERALLRIPSQTSQAQAVSANNIQDAEDGCQAVPLFGNKTREQTAEDSKASISKGSEKDQEIREEQKLAIKQVESNIVPLNIKDFASPVQGKHLRDIGNYYSEAFESYLFHAGIDYAEPEGTIIRATHGGKVIFIGQDPMLGQKVTLDCGEGWLVTYGGLDNLRVQDGETVVTQEALGQVGFFPGAEGENNQPQLHYEVWHNNELQRP